MLASSLVQILNVGLSFRTNPEQGSPGLHCYCLFSSIKAYNRSGTTQKTFVTQGIFFFNTSSVSMIQSSHHLPVEMQGCVENQPFPCISNDGFTPDGHSDPEGTGKAGC